MNTYSNDRGGMVYKYISTYFYATCLVLYAWYRANLETLTFLIYFTMLLPLSIPFQWHLNGKYMSTNHMNAWKLLCISNIIDGITTQSEVQACTFQQNSASSNLPMPLEIKKCG